MLDLFDTQAHKLVKVLAVADKQQEAQQKMMRFQLMQNQLEAVRAQLQQLVSHAEELSVTKLTLENLNIPKSSEAFIPLGSGNFVKGKVEDSKSILVSMGGGAAIKKNKEEAVKIVEDKIEKTQDQLNELAGAEQHIVAELTRMQPEIQALMAGQ